ncbi:MAG: PilZ domain-containing protein [Candidatus Cloacimonetes bacterium]|nr:PilZ domain-containing protein [Candidatus Cloacimonadota bacterium]MCA9785830.1 PilZ domain-containing protein [Candidatus Cloacimonadota bacterium]
MSDNSREFTRVMVRVTVNLADGERSIVSSRSRDLSLNGIFLYCEPTLEPGTTCDVGIDLGGEEGLVIRAQARVVRVDPDGLALGFEHLVGSDSLEHLQNLVRYNAGEVENVEEELRRHVGLRARPV